MKAVNYFNGGLHLRLKDVNSHHNQYGITVVSRTAKRALELIQEFDPSMTAHHMRGYYSRMDAPPTPLASQIPALSEDAIYLSLKNGTVYVLLTKEMIR